MYAIWQIIDNIRKALSNMENTLSYTISDTLSRIPKKILNNKNNPHLYEYILYEIAHEKCLNFSEIAYFIYNPDFHLCKGISGMKCDELKESYDSDIDQWDESPKFQSIINKSNYNATIKSTEFCTLHDQGIDSIVNEIKKSLNIDQIDYFHWNTTNNNIGILIYAKKNHDEIAKNILEDATALLSFCPIY